VKRFTVVTVSRSDYGIYLPVLRRIDADPDLALDLIVSGTHLAPEFGTTVREIEQDGFQIRDRLEMLLSSDSPEGLSKAMGLGILSFAQAYARRRPDWLIVLGDRFEMFAAAAAAVSFKIPIAHIHGGESTAGAIDESFRHAMTKMSHLHFPSTRKYAARIEQLGESPERICVSGAPSLDHLHQLEHLDRDEFRQRFGLDISQTPLLVTFHPATLEYEQAHTQFLALLAALEQCERQAIFTYPNADPMGRGIAQEMKLFVARHPRHQMVENLGSLGYWNLMRHAAAMVGNSSSGIIEAASFELPVVNIGVRQSGRIRARNVIDVPCEIDEISAAIRTAVSADFREKLRGLKNPYGDGRAAERIVNRLKSVHVDESFFLKSFRDLHWNAA
jgi:UDP-N-acetylglucosamine 2-epimerase (non-hydrolysing)/GDP/UDP-N,N'-diacetylbacillosamine 2-epimerase (hydrolysing)